MREFDQAETEHPLGQAVTRAACGDRASQLLLSLNKRCESQVALIHELSERVAAQSELLSRRAERPATPGDGCWLTEVDYCPLGEVQR